MAAAIQQSIAVRIASLDAKEAALLAAGGTPHFKIRTGAIPATPAAARTGTALCDITLPADPFAGASNPSGTIVSKVMQGSWQDGDADASGNGGYFSLEDSAGACHFQGLVSMAWTANYGVTLDLQMHNAGNVYKCTTAGVTSAASPPTGTGTGIADGTAVWSYVGPVGATLDNSAIVIHQVVNVTSFTIQDNNI